MRQESELKGNRNAHYQKEEADKVINAIFFMITICCSSLTHMKPRHNHFTHMCVFGAFTLALIYCVKCVCTTHENVCFNIFTAGMILALVIYFHFVAPPSSGHTAHQVHLSSGIVDIFYDS